MENQKEEVLIHDFGNHKVFSVKKGSKACFWVKSNLDMDKVVKYVIHPYHSSRRLKNVELKFFDELTKNIIYNGEIYEIN